MRLLRLEDGARLHHHEGRGQAGHARQEVGHAAIGTEPETNHRRRHARRLVREAPVAGERIRESGSHRRSVDGSNHGLLDFDDHAGELRERAGGGLPLVALQGDFGETGDAAVGATAEPLGVAAGAERPSGSGEEDDPHLVLLPQVAEQIDQIRRQRPVHRVQPLRPVQRHDTNAVLDLENNVSFRTHLDFLLFKFCRKVPSDCVQPWNGSLIKPAPTGIRSPCVDALDRTDCKLYVGARDK